MPKKLLSATETPIEHMANTAAIEYRTKIHLISFNQNPPSILINSKLLFLML